MASYGKSEKLPPLPLDTSGDSPPGAPPGHKALDVERWRRNGRMDTLKEK